MNQDSSKSAAPVKRDISIDILRGTAVFFMLITHVNAAFLGEKNLFLDKFSFVGATVCFSTFLFCSSAIYGLKLRKGEIPLMNMVPRLLKLLGIYYFLALFITVISSGSLPDPDQIVRLISFQELPIFIEFIIAFFLFDIFIYLMQRPLIKLLEKPALLIIISVIVYALSRYLSELDWGGGYITTIKALTVGHDPIHSFGILSYLPIFVAGLIWGNKLLEHKNRYNILLAIFLTSLVALLIGEHLFSIRWERWPPSTLFHLYGIVYISGVYLLVKSIDRVTFASNYFEYMSKNTLGFYVSHILFIFIINEIFITSNLDALGTAFMNILIFVLCTLGIYLLGLKNRIVAR